MVFIISSLHSCGANMANKKKHTHTQYSRYVSRESLCDFHAILCLCTIYTIIGDSPERARNQTAHEDKWVCVCCTQYTFSHACSFPTQTHTHSVIEYSIERADCDAVFYIAFGHNYGDPKTCNLSNTHWPE